MKLFPGVVFGLRLECISDSTLSFETNPVSHWLDRYWECTILPPETKEGHCRLGWSLSTGSLQGPVGYDKSSYAYRDIAGSKVSDRCRDSVVRNLPRKYRSCHRSVTDRAYYCEYISEGYTFMMTNPAKVHHIFSKYRTAASASTALRYITRSPSRCSLSVGHGSLYFLF